MHFRVADRVFVDESKARGYYVVATAATPGSVQASEKALRGLLKPGQRRIHFKSENDSRRRQLLARMCELDVRVVVWAAGRRPDKEARPLCLTALVEESVRAGAGRLLIERDESLMRADRRIIADVLRRERATDPQYLHVAPHEHPLLWVSDAVAWCHANGGDWVRRTEPLVGTRVIRL